MNTPLSTEFPSHQARQRRRGVALLEALVALLIMSLGMVAMVGIQSTIRRGSDVAKQRGEALRLAQTELETLRAYSVLAPDANAPAGTRDFASIQTALPQTDLGTPDSNASYTLTRTVSNWGGTPGNPLLQALPNLQAVQIDVNWLERSAANQNIRLNSFIAGASPALAASLRIPGHPGGTRNPRDRHASIPLSAKDLGNKTSGFVPSPNQTVAWVFNNLTGVITGKCLVPMGTINAELTQADLQTCTTVHGLLLSGFVWFSTAAAPDPNRPEGTARPIEFKMATIMVGPEDAPVQTPSYECYSDAPSSTPSAMRYVSYYCAVYPAFSDKPVWSSGVPYVPCHRDQPRMRYTVCGAMHADTSVQASHTAGLRVIVRRADLTNSSPDPAWHVCRYSADYSRDGKLSNEEHPLAYVNVNKPLTGQNFLIIPSTLAFCPTGAAINPDLGVFRNMSTVMHQPNGSPLGVETSVSP